MSSILPVGSLVHSFGVGFYNVNQSLTVDLDRIEPIGRGKSIHVNLTEDQPSKIKYEFFDRWGPWPEYPKKVLEGFANPNDLYLATLLGQGYTGELCYYPVVKDDTIISWAGAPRSDSNKDSGVEIIVSRDYVASNNDDFFAPISSSSHSDDLGELEAFFNLYSFPYKLKADFNWRSTGVYVSRLLIEIRSKKLKPEGISALIMSKGFFEERFRQFYEEIIKDNPGSRRPVYSPSLELLFE